MLLTFFLRLGQKIHKSWDCSRKNEHLIKENISLPPRGTRYWYCRIGLLRWSKIQAKIEHHWHLWWKARNSWKWFLELSHPTSVWNYSISWSQWQSCQVVTWHFIFLLLYFLHLPSYTCLQTIRYPHTALPCHIFLRLPVGIHDLFVCVWEYFMLSGVECMLYPGVSVGCVTAVSCASYVMKLMI